MMGAALVRFEVEDLYVDLVFNDYLVGVQRRRQSKSPRMSQKPHEYRVKRAWPFYRSSSGFACTRGHEELSRKRPVL